MNRLNRIWLCTSLLLLLLVGCKKKDEGGTVYITTDPPTKYFHSTVMCPYIYYKGVLKSKPIKKLKALEDKMIPCEYCYSRIDLDLFYMRGTYKDSLEKGEENNDGDDDVDEGLYPDDRMDVGRFPY